MGAFRSILSPRPHYIHYGLGNLKLSLCAVMDQYLHYIPRRLSDLVYFSLHRTGEVSLGRASPLNNALTTRQFAYLSIGNSKSYRFPMRKTLKRKKKGGRNVPLCALPAILNVVASDAYV
jgi:hypothetical protein